MYEFEKFLSRIARFEITMKKLNASRWLEKNGFRFMIDFGIGNAVEKAKQERTRIRNASKKANRYLQTRKSNK